jgi:hypothetical protein
MKITRKQYEKIQNICRANVEKLLKDDIVIAGSSPVQMKEIKRI